MWRSAARSIGACLALLCFFAVSSADPSPPSRADVTSGVRVAQRLIDTIPSPWRLDGDVRMAGDDAPVAQGNFVQASYALNKASLDSVATFSRAGNAMQFDSSGYLTYGPNNLLTYSNTFSNAAWAKNLVTVTGGVSDPVGGSNASTITATGVNAFIYQGPTVAAGTRIASQLYVKRRTGSGSVFLYDQNGYTNTVDITASISGGGWVAINPSVLTASGSNAYVGVKINTSGDAVDVYAGVVAAVTYETAVRTQDQVITTSAAYYGPRFDNTYNGSSWVPAGLLVEGAATNIVLQNRDLTNAAWTKGATATVAKDQVGIDGVSNSASSFTGGAVSATNTVLQSITLASSTRAQSAWVKRLAGSGTVNMTTDGGATWNAITLTGSYTLVQFSQAAVTNPSVGFQITTLNDKIAVDVVQNETGTFATSSIITGASAVTRAAETVQLTGPAASALQAAQGSVVVQVTDQSIGYGATGGVVLGGSSTYWLDLASGNMYSNSASHFLNTANAAVAGSPYRAGVAWNASGRSLAMNGGTVVSDAFGGWAGTTPYLGSLSGTSNFANAHFASLAIYNSRLPDATLQQKSVVGASYAANDNGIRYAFADNDNLPVHWRVAL